MIVREKDFVPRHPAWVTNPDVPADLKQAMIQEGFGEAYSWTQCETLDDDCTHCGEKLTLPFVFWAGATKNLCLHPRCASMLGSGLIRDNAELRDGKDKANAWLGEFKAHDI